LFTQFHCAKPPYKTTHETTYKLPATLVEMNVTFLMKILFHIREFFENGLTLMPTGWQQKVAILQLEK
jgi:hypothetical protein